MSFLFFFFQAEDGIRDLVRSRGLGDVYKRQVKDIVVKETEAEIENDFEIILPNELLNRSKTVDSTFAIAQKVINPVSYTHLTLPTSDLV